MRTNRIVIALLLLLTCTPWVNAQEGNRWQCNIHEYEYDMSVFFELQLDDVPISDYDGYEVAAFVGDECRGVAEIQTATKKDGTKVQYGYLRVRSNKTEGETINFMVFYAPTNKTYYSTETIFFKNLEREGLPSSPFVFNIKDLEVEDVDGDGNTDDKDMAFLLEKVRQKELADNLSQNGDSETCQELINKAKQDIDDYAYDNTKSLDENRNSLHAIITQLESDLVTQRLSDYDMYKTGQKDAADALAIDGDSENCLQLIATAKDEIDALIYDRSKTPAENKAAVDAIMEKLKEDISNQRSFERGIYVNTFTGTFDNLPHGINVEVPSGAYVKYGENVDYCWLDDSPVYENAGTYVVYYEVFKDGWYPVKGSAVITIEKARLTSVTLENTEFIYDTFGQQPQTVKIISVKAGTLDVPADAYTVEGDTESEIGNYTVKITAKENSNFTGVVTADFTIVEEKINIDDQGSESGGEDKAIQLSVTVLDQTEKKLRIDKLDVLSEETAISIPSQIRDYEVVEIADGAMREDSHVTDIYLPDTKATISIGKDALPSTAYIHAPLHLLDDYALMPSLKPYYESSRISAETTPKNKFWTLSCGVDIILPEGLTPYICKTHNNDGVILLELKDHTIKANNGVLIESHDSYIGSAFEITASPSKERPSGMTPPTENAMSYEGNELYPVIEKQHFNPSEWYILAENEFHELQFDDNSKVPACKAILPRKNSNQARTLYLYTDYDATKIETVPMINENQNDIWHDLHGRKMERKPAKSGIYLKNGKKVIIK